MSPSELFYGIVCCVALLYCITLVSSKLQLQSLITNNHNLYQSDFQKEDKYKQV